MEEKLNDVVLEDVVGGAGTTDTKVKIVNCDYVNLRDAAGNGEKIGKIRCNTIVTCHGKKNGWANVTYNGLTGWIYKDYYKDA